MSSIPADLALFRARVLLLPGSCLTRGTGPGVDCLSSATSDRKALRDVEATGAGGSRWKALLTLGRDDASEQAGL